MNPGIVIIAALLLITLDLAFIRWIRNRWEPTDSSDQVRLLGLYSPILTWLKHRKLPKMKPRDQKIVKGKQPTETANGPSIKAFQLNIPKTFPKIKIKSIVNIQPITMLEILVLSVVAIAYAFALLNFDPDLGLTGGEYQVHVGFMSLFNRWINGEIDFPLWNPIIGYGRSLVADPFLFFFNPFVSLPMVIFGLVNGTKVALIINFFVAGLGMWFLVRVLKFERVPGLWCSLLYMMSGAIPSYLTIGQIQLSFSLGWLPWSVAGLLWVIKDPSLLAIAVASIAQALFFFTGNLYHQVYGLFCLLIISLVSILDWSEFRLRKEIVKRITLLGLFSLGLIAVQFLPMLASQLSIHNTGGYPENDEVFQGSQLPEYAFLNFVVADPIFSRDPVLEKIPYPQENYRYIGIAPVLMLLFLVPAFGQGNRKEIIAFGGSFLFLLAWAGLRYTFIRQIYQFLPVLYQFRFPGRALSVGVLFLIILGGYGLNHLWLKLRLKRDQHGRDKNTPILSKQGYSLVFAVLCLGLILSLRRVYGENRDLIYTEWIYKPEIPLAIDWIQGQNPDDLTINVTHNIADKIILDAYKHNIRSPDYIDGWRAEGAPYLIGRPDSLKIQPPYRLDWEWEDYEATDYVLVNQIGELRIWRAINIYPYAFLIPMEYLLASPEITPNEVIPALSHNRIGTNIITVDIEASENSMLVVSEAWFKGWKVIVDGQPTNIVSVSNFLAVQIPPGRHQVIFDYDPTSFKIGLFISGLTLLIIVGIVVRNRRKAVQTDGT